jgi:hypothetical protein
VGNAKTIYHVNSMRVATSLPATLGSIDSFVSLGVDLSRSLPRIPFRRLRRDMRQDESASSLNGLIEIGAGDWLRIRGETYPFKSIKAVDVTEEDNGVWLVLIWGGSAMLMWFAFFSWWWTGPWKLVPMLLCGVVGGLLGGYLCTTILRSFSVILTLRRSGSEKSENPQEPIVVAENLDEIKATEIKALIDRLLEGNGATTP